MVLLFCLATTSIDSKREMCHKLYEVGDEKKEGKQKKDKITSNPIRLSIAHSSAVRSTPSANPSPSIGYVDWTNYLTEATASSSYTLTGYLAAATTSPSSISVSHPMKAATSSSPAASFSSHTATPTTTTTTTTTYTPPLKQACGYFEKLVV